MEILLSLNEQLAVTHFIRAFFSPQDQWSVLHVSQGIVVEAIASDQVYILKVMRGGFNSLAPLQARLDWIRYLYTHGLAVPDLVQSNQGNLIETITIAGNEYIAYAYVKYDLTPANSINWSDRQMPAKLGEVMAKMHLLASNYQQEKGLANFDCILAAPWLHPDGLLHPSQAALHEPIRRLRETLESFPQDETIFGLVHDDLHTGNIFHVQGQVVILDFDCTVQHWYAADIASALMFRVWIGPTKETLIEEAKSFLERLLLGYQKHHPLPEGWAEMLPVFLKLRELSQYWDYRHLDLKNAQPDSLFLYLYESLRYEKPFLPIDDHYV